MTDPPDTGKANAVNRLLNIVSRLRGPDGCPWDREQTLNSLKQYLIEETYEVIEAVESDDPGRHAEELGDVLLQIVMQAHIRTEQKQFTFDDVVNSICEKLIRRHPHVFGDVKVSGSKEVLRNWEIIKSGEKKTAKKSVVEGIPRGLPALQRAQRVQSRAARVGFDWTELKDVVSKVEEELAEMKAAISEGDPASIKRETGDLLFAIVNLSRFQNMSAEECLDAAISKFITRFQRVEQRIHAEGRTFADCTLADMDVHWEAVKNEERSSASAGNS
jgi:tetrapyrrole methylase family protein / MazG family protein